MGAQHHEIKYRVTNAYLHESNGFKFCWSLKPSDWWATFRSIEFKIRLPLLKNLSDFSYLYILNIEPE